jgi:hypothetical protein
LAVSFLILLAFLILVERLQSISQFLMVLWIILAATALGRFKLLVKDWLIFVAFLYLFDILRGTAYVLTCKFRLPVHTLYVLKIEKALFGSVPSVSLQHLLLRSGPAGPFTWAEKTLTFFYASHFAAFIFVGLFIWIYKPGHLARYMNSFYLLISSGVLLYALVPTVAPWMASSLFELLPPLTWFNNLILKAAIPALRSGFDLNPVSAMPSLHAGFPILCCLLLWTLFRWKALPFYLYTLVVLFTIIYTGDHYVTDALAGLGLAVICNLCAGRLLKKKTYLRDEAAAGGSPNGASPSGSKPSIAWADLRNPLATGVAIFLAAFVLTRTNKALVPPGIDIHDSNVPRYADFFRNERQYGTSFAVQFYFGNHALVWKEYRTALRHFQRSLELARNPDEGRDIREKIEICRRAMGPGG